jgi:hypothetical protein
MEMYRYTIAYRCLMFGCLLICAEGAQLVPAFSENRVTISVEGVVSAHCGLLGDNSSSGHIIKLDNFYAGGANEYGFVIDCNAPFSYSLESENGALTLGGVREERAASGKVLYTIASRIQTDGNVINDHCPSETIKSGQATCQLHDSGSSVAINQRAALTFTWRSQPLNLPAGTYSDWLIFTVALRP